MEPGPSQGRRAALVVAAIVILAGAGFAVSALLSDDDESEVVLTETVPPAATTGPGDEKKRKDKGANGGEASGPVAGSACAGTGGISKLKASGTSCSEAQAVAKQWERMSNSCNTIDNPNSPEGYKRTCTVSGYRCTATRDTRSDRRFVACTKGSAKIRFTWS